MEARQFSAVTVDGRTKEIIDRIAAATDRSRARVVRDAMRAYEQNSGVRKALAAAERPALEVRA